MSDTGNPHAAKNNGKGTEFISDNQQKGLKFWVIDGYLQNVITAVTEGFQCPRDNVVAFMYATASAAIGRKATCKFGNYTNHATLWQMVINDSSRGKTKPLNWLCRPIDEREDDAMRRYRREMEKWREGKQDGEQPTLRHHVINNASDEAVLRELAYNGDTFWRNDELASMLTGFGRYSQSGSGNIVAHLLSIFDNSSINITRVTTDPLRLQCPNLNVVGGIQPGALKRHTRPEWWGNGFMQRWLYVWPEVGPTPPYKEVEIAREHADYWDKTITLLLEMQPVTLKEDEAAKSMRIEAVNKWNKLADEADRAGTPDIGAGYRKMAIHLCRWAIVTALLANKTTIDEYVMQCSLQCMDYFTATMLKVYDYCNGKEQPKRLTFAEMVRGINEVHPIINQSQFAGSIGCSQQQINNILKNVDKTESVK